MHEFKEFVNHCFKELPVGSEKAWILANNIHDVWGYDGLVVLSSLLFTETQKILRKTKGTLLEDWCWNKMNFIYLLYLIILVLIVSAGIFLESFIILISILNLLSLIPTILLYLSCCVSHTSKLLENCELFSNKQPSQCFCFYLNDSDQKPLLVLLMHSPTDWSNSPAQCVEVLPGPFSAIDLVVKLLCHDAFCICIIQMGQVHCKMEEQNVNLYFRNKGTHLYTGRYVHHKKCVNHIDPYKRLLLYSLFYMSLDWSLLFYFRWNLTCHIKQINLIYFTYPS